jgi:hypothetical protein
VPADGFVISWAESENPTAGPFDHVLGRATVLSDHEARLYTGPAGADCVAVGAATEVDATILIARSGYENYRMRACLGARVSPADKLAITTMLTTAEIR